MNNLVILKNNEAFTTSQIIAEGTGNQHKNVKELIVKYQDDLKDFGKVHVLNATLETKGGVQEITYYELNEEQATFLMTLLRNSKVVVAFKKELVKQFYVMRQYIIEHNSPHWQQTRLTSKENRRLETDEIKRLIEYAKQQGSKNMDKQGYVIYSKLANKVCGITNRDNATVSQLNNLVLVENILNNCIKNGIENNKHYKEIYQDCKNRLAQFLEITYLRIA